jgi:hypothetical protein
MRVAVAVVLFALLGAMGYASGGPEGTTIEFTGVRQVVVKAQFLDVEIVGTATRRVEMNADERTISQVRQEQVGSTLNIWIVRTWPFGWEENGRLLVHVPRGTRVRVETITGSVDVRDASTGACELKTVSGPIRVRGVEGDLKLESVSGGIEMIDTAGSVRASTISGSIQGDRIRLLRDSSFASVSGRVVIHPTTPLERLRFDLSSLSGRIEVGSIGASRGLRMGFGGPLVKAHTVSGALIFTETEDR